MKTRDALQAAHDVGEVRPKDAAISVQLVDHDVLQVRKEPRPARVMRHDARVQHVRIGEQNPSALPRSPACIVRGVAIICDRPDVQIGIAHQPAQCFFLITGQRFGRKKIEGRCARVGGERLQDRQVVAKALAGGGRRRDDDVLALRGELERARLMAIQLSDAPLMQRSLDPRRQPRRHVRDARLMRLDRVAPGHVPPRTVGAPTLENLRGALGPRPWLVHPPKSLLTRRCVAPHCAHAQHCTVV